MSGYFRAVAADFDGTLTEGARPDDAVLHTIAELRATGVRVVLATGRILGELRHAFPDVDEHFDAIVAENGALISGPHGRRLLADPVDDVLEDALLRRHVPVRAGEVLLACDASHDRVVLEEIGRLGLDCQILRNRAALMVLPAGVTKGSGLLEALSDLGVSPHSTITIGDAENDRSLLDAGEYGVAVANAVEALMIHADMVLDEVDGSGVVELLRGPLLTGERRVRSTRWQVAIGTTSDGDPVIIPASQVNVLIAGGTGMGKSYIAGLLAEEVTELGYSAVVVDIEGDHLGLDDLRGVLSVGGAEPLPGHPTGRAATSLYEFHHILRQSADDVIEHHLERKDFSRWIHAATRDDELCDSFAESERTLDQTDIGAVREALVQAIEQRYLE